MSCREFLSAQIVPLATSFRMIEQTLPRIYQGFGTVEGILDLKHQGSTLLVEDTVFPVIGFIPKAVHQHHQPGQLQRFGVFPGALEGKLAFTVLKVSPNATVGIKLKGCWEERYGVPYLVVYRNRLFSPNDTKLRVLVPIVWEDAPPADGRFWELEAEVKGGELSVTQVIGTFAAPPQAKRYRSPEELERIKAIAPPVRRVAAVPPTAPPLTLKEIRQMTTPAKIQLTCKLHQVPDYRELPDSRIEFFLSEGAGPVFTVRIKPKLFKKLTHHGYEHWVAAISGDLGEATETGFELQNVAVQVFEKKPPTASSSTEPASEKGDRQVS
jgi:hypothetical protein